MKTISLGSFVIFLSLLSLNTFAADGKVDLKKVKQDQGPQVQVVQNRTFSKERRLKLSVFGGAVMTDPFLSVKTVGGTLGYNFSNFFTLQLMGWKDFANTTDSEKSFQTNNGFGTNNNKPKSLYALEGLWSPIYGKLNLLNSAIMYYDFHLGLGLGMRGTESGTTMAYLVNVGQDFFLSEHVTIEFNYRLLMFKQRILEKVIPANLGQEISKDFEMSNVFTLGVGFLF